MNQPTWYYQLNNQQIGPVSREELDSLLIQQIITPQTPVWCSGMEGWQPLGTIEGFVTAAGFYQNSIRPTCVTVLGILNIAFGAMGLLCTPLAIVGLVVPQPDNPFQGGVVMNIYSAFGILLGLVFGAILVASGIGLLNQKRWARQAAYCYGWTAIIWGIIATIINLFILLPSLSGVPESQMPGVIGGVVGGMCGGVIGLIYPIILIIFMKKTDIIAACNK